MPQELHITSPEEERLKKELDARNDIKAKRIKRYLAMPDLSRTPGSPIYEIVERVKRVPVVADFDIIDIPEIVPVDISFDLFDFPEDHPARSESDTYYADERNLLRTHDTVFWYYYLNHPSIKERIARKESLGTLCYGKVYRKDEIDRRHMNIFHQLGGWYLAPDEKEMVSIETLKSALSEIVKGVFGDVELRFNEDVFPYTDPSLEVEVKVKDEWVEILGGGLPKKSVLKNMGVEGYNGWAFGFGIERLAIISMELPDIRLLWSDDPRVKKQLVLGRTYEEVSKYPPVTRDISFIVKKGFVPNDYFDTIRDIGGELVEEVKLLDHYEDEEKFGKARESYTYRVVYRSGARTLTSEEIDTLHRELERETEERYGAEVR